MDDDLADWLADLPFHLACAIVLAVIAVVIVFIWVRVLEVQLRMRLSRLGGVTTLRRRLSYPCVICRDSMEAGEEVRTLSCGHVFHYGGTAKCELGIDAWLLEAVEMSCPTCLQVPHPVPWGKKQPPPSSPPPSSPQTSDSDSEEDSEEEELLFPSPWFDETLQQADSEEELLEGSPSQ